MGVTQTPIAAASIANSTDISFQSRRFRIGAVAGRTHATNLNIRRIK